METRGFRLFCWIALLSIPATACQCGADVYHAPGSTIREISSSYIAKLDSGKIVFLGTVERQAIRSDPTAKYWTRYRLVRIRVMETFRGPKRENLEVITGLGGGDCAFDFETGESYLVYAGEDDKGRLVTGMCTHTTLAEYAGPDIRVLRGEPPAPDDLLDEASYWKKFRAEHLSTICGRVSRADGQLVQAGLTLSRERRDGFPPKGYPTNDRYAESNPDGTFCVDYVRRGSYSLSAKDVDPSADIQFVGTLSKIRVEEGKSVTGLSLVLHRDLWYSLQKNVLLLVVLAATFGMSIVAIWLMWRRRRHVTSVPTGR